MLTETEKKELNIELENDIVLSKKLAEDFCVYLATYNTSIKDFVCHLTEQDYNKMQTVKFCGSNSEQVFLDDLPDRTFVDVKTYALTKDNFAMGFHPAFWNVLTNIERMALCQIALENFSGKTFQKFCYQDNTNDVVLLSNENDGVLNIFSFYNAELTGLDVLFGVANSENDIKRTLYAKRMLSERKKRNRNKVTDFESLEEMQYLSPLKTKKIDVEKMDSYEKAIFFDELYKRRFRATRMLTLELMKEHSIKLKDMYSKFFEKIEIEQKNIMETDLLVMSMLGSSNLERDKRYVRLKTFLYNENLVKKYNRYVDKFNRTLEIYNETTDEKESKKLNFLLVRIKKKLEELKSQEITEEQALKYFSKHFEEEKNEQANDDKQETKNSTKNSMEKNFC